MFYTLQEIAKQLRVHPITIVRWAEAKKFPQPVRLGRKYLFLKQQVDEFIARAQKTTSGAS